MAGVDPSVVIAACILGAGLTVILGFAVGNLFRSRSHDTDGQQQEQNPFRERSREQTEYMREVRVRGNLLAWERAQEECRMGRGSNLSGSGSGSSDSRKMVSSLEPLKNR